jgi:hypothetical protein
MGVMLADTWAEAAPQNTSNSGIAKMISFLMVVTFVSGV